MSVRGQIFVVTAPSGTGKTTLVRHLHQAVDGIEAAISHTTRAARSGEVDGEDYHFVDEPRFLQMIEQSAFVEHAGNYGHRYGTSHQALEAVRATGNDLLLEIDWQGAEQIKAQRPEAVWILIAPPSLAVLEARLQARGTDSDSAIETRMAAAQVELDKARDADYLIINQSLDAAALALESIVRAERQRMARVLASEPEFEYLFTKARQPR